MNRFLTEVIARALRMGIAVGAAVIVLSGPAATSRAGNPSAMSLSVASAAVGIDISILPGDELAGNQAALDAFGRAAAQWEAHLQDPVTVFINADLAPLGDGVLYQTATDVLLFDYSQVVRPALIADAAGEIGDEVVNLLPAGIPGFNARAGFNVVAGTVQVPGASAKALGIDPRLGPIAIDGSITINTFDAGFLNELDLDNRDGVADFQKDFETLAAREIGRVLGFVTAGSHVDAVVRGEIAGPLDVSPTTMDLFRFPRGGAGDPATEADFTNFDRSLLATNLEDFDDLDNQWQLTTGVAGDGSLPVDSWKDAPSIVAVEIGIMDPTLATAIAGSDVVVPISAADLRVLDLIGYDVGPLVPIPEPGTLAASLAVLLALAICSGARRVLSFLPARGRMLASPAAVKVNCLPEPTRTNAFLGTGKRDESTIPPPGRVDHRVPVRPLWMPATTR